MRFMKCDHRLHHVRIERILKWSYFWHSYGYSFFFYSEKTSIAAKSSWSVFFTHIHLILMSEGNLWQIVQ